MVRSALLAVLAASAASSAGAQDIFKCIENGTTAYQSMPCANGQAETRMVVGGSRPRPEVQEATPPSHPARPTPTLRWSGPWRRTTLTLGMSDDEVLNLPGWGRPSRITRMKLTRAWHEEWTYGQANVGERRLHFANARLVDIVDKPTSDHVAQLTLQ
jgi:hypothetical protein